MTTARVARATAVANVTGAKGRVSRVTTSMPAGSLKARVSRVTHQVPSTTSVSMTLAAVAEALETVTVTASAAVGSTYSFSITDGIVLSGSGASRTFRTPGRLSGADVTVTVTATAPGSAPGSTSKTIHVYPQVEWIARAGVWRPVLASTV